MGPIPNLSGVGVLAVPLVTVTVSRPALFSTCSVDRKINITISRYAVNIYYLTLAYTKYRYLIIQRQRSIFFYTFGEVRSTVSDIQNRTGIFGGGQISSVGEF